MAKLIEIKDEQINVPEVLEAAEKLFVAIQNYEEWLNVIGNDPDSGTKFMSVLLSLTTLAKVLEETGFQSGSSFGSDIRSSRTGLPEALFSLRDVRREMYELINTTPIDSNGFHVHDHFSPGTEPFHFKPLTILKLKQAVEVLKRIANTNGGSDLLKLEGVKKDSKPLNHDPIQTDKPEWNSSLRELKFRGKVIKKWKRRAQNQTAIIEEFQRQAWLDVVVAPANLDGQQLCDAIRDLRKSVGNSGITFEGNGTGKGIRWRIVDSK